MSRRFKLGNPVRVRDGAGTTHDGRAGFVTEHGRPTLDRQRGEPYYRVHFSSGSFSYFPESELEPAISEPVADTEYEYAVKGVDGDGEWTHCAESRDHAEEVIRIVGGVLHRRPVGEWEEMPDGE